MERLNPGQLTRWRIVDGHRESDGRAIVADLPADCGLILAGARRADDHAIKRAARLRGIPVLTEHEGNARRVHDMRELRRALSAGTPVILLSALFPTSSHPGRAAMPTLRAATLARLSRGAGAMVLALGGMDARRYAALRRLGFDGWSGIRAFGARRRIRT